MNIPIQIDSTSISRAPNAAHYEYLATVRRRTDEIRLENDLWHRAGGEVVFQGTPQEIIHCERSKTELYLRKNI